MAELGRFLTESDDLEEEVNIEMLEYDFVRKCKDAKKLKAILKLLESGKEGF